MRQGEALAVDRRQLLAGAGALALAAALPAGAAARPGAAVLTPWRAATFRRLAAALRAAGDDALRHVEPAHALRALEAWLVARPPATRAHADAVLDLLGADGVPAPARLAHPGAAATAAQAHRAAARAAAVALAHAALGAEDRSA
jgi:hypothetical protein